MMDAIAVYRQRFRASEFLAHPLSAQERWELDQTLSVSSVGSLRYVQAALEEFIGRTQTDELILVAQVYDHAARLRSYELAATLREHIGLRLS